MDAVALDSVNDIIEIYLIPWGIKALVAIAVFVLGRWVAKIAVALLERLMRRAKAAAAADPPGACSCTYGGQIARRIGISTCRCRLLERIKLTFDAHGIRIPFPQREVHLYQADIKPTGRPPDRMGRRRFRPHSVVGCAVHAKAGSRRLAQARGCWSRTPSGGQIDRPMRFVASFSRNH